ncbi:MAG: XRE family transcriptional regulator [Ruminococcaceae bacterium]|nr:XRE family transcriptional regulator [Oscillospiraceae bacterium]
MNKFEIKPFQNIYNHKEHTCFIDGISIQEALCKIVDNSPKENAEYLGNVKGLTFAWTAELDWKGDVRFVSELVKTDSTILPVLLCEDDLDFSCIVVVVETGKTADFVLWKRIGYVDHSHEDFEEEKKSGILCTTAYSKEDWMKYKDNLAKESVDSAAWTQWILAHWDEELYRRRMNYTLPYYKSEGNIVWIDNLNWKFDKNEYDKQISLIYG